MAQTEIRWSAPEFPYYEKGRGWQVGVIVVAALVTVIALIQRNFLFAVFAVAGGFLVAFWGRRKPETLEFQLSDKGLDIRGKKFYPVETLTGFAIVERPVAEGEPAEPPELVIRTKSVVNPYLKMEIAKERTEEFRALLTAHLPEIEYQEGLADWIAKVLRF